MAHGIDEKARRGCINKHGDANGHILLALCSSAHLNGACHLIDGNSHGSLLSPNISYAALERWLQMDWMIPTMVNCINMELEPKLINGSGMPVMGISPMHIPMFSKI